MRPKDQEAMDGRQDMIHCTRLALPYLGPAPPLQIQTYHSGPTASANYNKAINVTSFLQHLSLATFLDIGI